MDALDLEDAHAERQEAWEARVEAHEQRLEKEFTEQFLGPHPLRSEAWFALPRPGQWRPIFAELLRDMVDEDYSRVNALIDLWRDAAKGKPVQEKARQLLEDMAWFYAEQNAEEHASQDE